MGKNDLKEIVYQQSRIIVIQVLEATGHALIDVAERMKNQPGEMVSKQAIIQEG